MVTKIVDPTQDSGSTPPAPPPPTEEPTPDQLRIKELEHRLALAEGRTDAEPGTVPIQDPGATENIVIHFVEDGFTALGHVWYRGQVIEFEPGSQAYEDTRDRNGKSWLDLRDDDEGQYDHWDKIMFRSGPWRGRRYRDGTYETLKVQDRSSTGTVPPPTDDELARAEQQERTRSKLAPVLPDR